MLRVLVVAEDPSGRERLAELLTDHPECTVVAQAGIDEGGLLELDADVVLWDLGPDVGAARRQIAEGLEIDLPLVMLGPRELVPEALAAGARGYLSEQAHVHRLGIALQAAVEGLQVADVPPPGPPPLGEEHPVEELTPRESEVLQLLAEGLSNKEIAGRLQISEHTVKFHVNAILGKLGAHTRTEAVTRAARQGLIVL